MSKYTTESLFFIAPADCHLLWTDGSITAKQVATRTVDSRGDICLHFTGSKQDQHIAALVADAMVGGVTFSTQTLYFPA